MKSLIKVVSVLMLALVAVCLVNHGSFMESFDNGFYQMQTPLETVAAFMGNISYHVINFK